MNFIWLDQLSLALSSAALESIVTEQIQAPRNSKENSSELKIRVINLLVGVHNFSTSFERFVENAKLLLSLVVDKQDSMGIVDLTNDLKWGEVWVRYLTRELIQMDKLNIIIKEQVYDLNPAAIASIPELNTFVNSKYRVRFGTDFPLLDQLNSYPTHVPVTVLEDLIVQLEPFVSQLSNARKKFQDIIKKENSFSEFTSLLDSLE